MRNISSRSIFSAIVVVIMFSLAVACSSYNDSIGSGSPKGMKPPTAAPGDLFKKYNLDKIKLPAGFKISVYADVPNARQMCWGDKGTLFVGNREGGKVYAVRDENKDGVGEKVYVIASGLSMPTGVAFRKGSLFVAEISRILRYDNIEANLTNPPKPAVVFDKYPTDEHHGWKFIRFGPDGKLYVPVGAPCNVCEKDNPIYATITRMNADGTGMEIFARGIRNTVGFDWHPKTKELWFTDNGRDNLGDNVPNDELNRAPKKGMNFGFPYCHEGDILDPEFGKEKNCADYTPPAQKMGPHVAAIGMRFYTGKMFPAEYRDQIFVAEHGSWNRTVPIGYRVMVVKLDKNSKPTSLTPFAEGWLQNKDVSGRPADVEIARDGSLLISDDKQGAIYRVVYRK